MDYLLSNYDGESCEFQQFIASYMDKVMQNSNVKDEDIVKKRYKSFYVLSCYIRCQGNWKVSDFQSVLDSIYGMKQDFASLMPNSTIKYLKINTVFQMGLQILRDTVGYDENFPDADLELSKDFSISDYKDKIHTIFTDNTDVYTSGDLIDGKHKLHKAALTEDILEEIIEQPPKGKRGRQKAAVSRVVLNTEIVKNLLEKYSTRIWIDQSITWIKDVEEKVFPIPTAFICYKPSGVSNWEKIAQDTKAQWDRNLAATSGIAINHGFQEGDWADDQADNLGPYPQHVHHSSSKDATSSKSDRRSSSSSSAPNPSALKNKPPTHLESNSKKRAADSTHSPSPAPKRASLGTSSNVEINHMKNVQGNFKRKYTDIDPLNDVFEEEDPVKARVSHESLLERPAHRQVNPRRDVEPAKQNSKTTAKIDFDSASASTDSDSNINGHTGVNALLNLKSNQHKSNVYPDRQHKQRSHSPHNSIISNHKPKPPIVRWTFEKEELLIEAVGTHGEGNWSSILGDPVYSQEFIGRSNMNIKDKYRNLLNKQNKF